MNPVPIAIKAVDYAVAFGAALVLTLVLTPLVRNMNRRLGMVDKPDPRRINKVPIPRGGGIALFLGVIASYSVFTLVSGRPPLQGDGVTTATYWKLVAIATGVTALGWLDDKFSLRPKVKLAGQVVCAFLAWWWAGLGFSELWPGLPVWLDAFITVFWIVGAVNAFNLIDGLDGLASGIAFIATLGLAGTLFIVENPQAALFHFAFAGGLLGFLRYNYNPASVFLGDSGSMFIGFVLAVLPLVSQIPDSFFVSVGVPLLAMGVPIFDTSLAIIRRYIRHVIRKLDDRDAGNDKVMTADADHLHHRILRAVGANQRKAAWALYALTAALVAIGFFGTYMRSRTAGLWLIAVALACVVIFKNMARIELYDAGRLLNDVARSNTTAARRRRARLAVPIMLGCDLFLLIGAFFALGFASHMRVSARDLRLALLLHVTAVFVFLVFFNVYRTVWARAMLSNYFRLGLACFFGALFGGAAVVFATRVAPVTAVRFTISYAVLSFFLLALLRLLRPIARDMFYALDCSRLKGRKDVSRILVYGSGLRYRTFRRELVRTTSANTRIIVGLLDDDILIRGHYIGGIRVEGTLAEAPEIINRLNADAVVVACQVTPEWLDVVRQTLAPTGVRITRFGFKEETI